MSSRYLRPKFGFEDPAQESVLLRSIRSALRGSNPDRDWQHSAFYDASSASEAEDVVEELLWDQERVVLCAGGVIQKQWSFLHEGQPVQWACNGWLQQAGAIVASRSSGHYTNDAHSGLSRDRERDNRTRTTFGPFERAEQERRREIEPEERVRATFVFLRSVGWIYLRNGVEYTFSLPFIVRKAWPLYPHGVIIQRVLEPTEVQEAELTGDDTLPTVFSLTSPLAEATVVDHAANIVGGFHSVPLSLVHEDDSSDQVSEPLSACEVIVWVSHQGHGEDSDLLVTVHPDRRQLSVWRYAYVRLGDIPFSQAQSRFRKKRASMAAGAPDNQRQTPAGNEGFAWRPQPPPEDHHPLETFPTSPARHHSSISSLKTMSSLSAPKALAPLVTGTSRAQLSLMGEQRSPPDREIRRMILGGRTEPDIALGPADYTRMRSTHWITRLFTMDLTEHEYVIKALLNHYSNRDFLSRIVQLTGQK